MANQWIVQFDVMIIIAIAMICLNDAVSLAGISASKRGAEEIVEATLIRQKLFVCSQNSMYNQKNKLLSIKQTVSTNSELKFETLRGLFQ